MFRATYRSPYFLSDAVYEKDCAAATRRVCAAAKELGRPWLLGISLPIVSLPITADVPAAETHGLENHDSRNVLVLQAIMRTLAETSVPAPDGCVHTIVYVGVAQSDWRLMNNTAWLFRAALELFVADPSRLMLEYRLVSYPGGAGGMTLADMYNALAAHALEDGCDYIMPLNDDMIVWGHWRELHIDLLLFGDPRRPQPDRPANFGMAIVKEPSQTYACPPYPMVARLHFQLYGGRLFDDFFPSFGIDTAMCDVYAAHGGLLLYNKIAQLNHLALAGPTADPVRTKLSYRPKDSIIRYHVQPEWEQYPKRTVLYKELVRRFLDYYARTRKTHGFGCSELQPLLNITQFLSLVKSERTFDNFFLCTERLY